MKYISKFVEEQQALAEEYKERGRVLWDGSQGPRVSQIPRLKGKAAIKQYKKSRSRG